MENEEPKVRLRFGIVRVYLLFLVTQGAFGAVIAGLLRYAGESWTKAAIVVVITVGPIPIFTTAMAFLLGRLAVGEKGLFYRAPNHVRQLGTWVDHLIPWDEVESIRPSPFGFGISAGRARFNLLPPSAS
jgi:hypothetical protein